MIHELKTLSNYFQSMSKCEKTFEIRKKDRNFQVGDLLALNEIMDNTPEVTYTGNSMIVRIDYILDDEKYCKKDYVILGIKPCDVIFYNKLYLGAAKKERVYQNKVGG